MRITFEPLKPEHSRIAAHLRQADIDEINALNGLSPEVAVAYSIANSEKGAAVFIDGDLSAVFGISRSVIWLVGTDEINKHPVAFYRTSRRIFRKLSNGYPKLENYVDTRNIPYLRWLQWLGFDISPPVDAGGVSFHHVVWEARKCAL